MISGLITAYLLPNIKRVVVIGGAVLALFGYVYLKGVSHGKANIQRKWDAAVARAAQEGRNARGDAERAVGGKPVGRVRDPFLRD